MKGEEVCKSLSDDLVERIIAMVPFPSIFKARCLSKSWLAKLSPISSQDDEGKKRLAIALQTQVRGRSKDWGTFCPVRIGKEGDLVSYGLANHNWQTMPSLSFLPENVLTLCLHLEGPLLYARDTLIGEMYVANILTRTWKQLPPPPVIECLVHWSTLVIDKSLEMYKVILLCEQNPCDCYLVQIYDPTSDSWSSKNVGSGARFAAGNTGFLSSTAYLKGVLYLVAGFDPPYLWSFNVEEGTLEELELSFSGDLEADNWYHLVVCETDLLMIVSKTIYRQEFQRVLKIDVGSSRLVQLTEGPPVALTIGSPFKIPVTDGYYVYFGLGEDDSRMLSYNRVSDTWDCLLAPPTATANTENEWIGSSIQPGLNPFVAV